MLVGYLQLVRFLLHRTQFSANCRNISAFRWLVFVCFGCLGFSSASAQKLVVLDSGIPSSGEVVIDYTKLAVLDSASCSFSISDALRASWGNSKDELFNSKTEGCHWVRAKVRLDSPANPNASGSSSAFAKTRNGWMVEVGHHGLNTLYLVAGDTVIDSLAMGNDLPLNDRAYAHVWSKSYLNIAPISLNYDQVYDLVFKYSNLSGQSLYGTNDKLAVTFLSAEGVDADARLHLVFSGLMMGGLLLLFLYQLAQWVVYRTELGLTYCIMLLGLMSYIMYDDFLLHSIFANAQVSELWLFVTGSLGLLGFFRFAQLTLKAVNFEPSRDRVLSVLFKVKLGEVVFYSVLALFAKRLWSQQLAAFVPEGFRVLLLMTLLVFSWVVISHFRENRDAATRAFMLGNLSLVAGVLIVATQAYILPYADLAPVGWYLNFIWPVFDYIIEAGIVGMALCFAFAVAMLTKEREIGIERAYSRRLVDVEMKALRSQMNPHFLFNGLNSIKSFVIDNKRHEAADYLTKFSRLIRRVLENSKASLIPLSQELETLGFYLEMESMRFDDLFSYEIDIDERVDLKRIQVPPTLIQPFVENSIWHGLLPKSEGEKKISISVSNNVRTDVVEIVIEDNGIGRDASEARRVKLPTRRKSLGMEITAERIAMLKELYGFSADLKFVDMKDNNGLATGTKVIIEIYQL